jgi:hypothetical protein
MGFELKFITCAFFNPEKENATFLFYFAWGASQVDLEWLRKLVNVQKIAGSSPARPTFREA